MHEGHGQVDGGLGLASGVGGSGHIGGARSRQYSEDDDDDLTVEHNGETNRRPSLEAARLGEGGWRSKEPRFVDCSLSASGVTGVCLGGDDTGTGSERSKGGSGRD